MIGTGANGESNGRHDDLDEAVTAAGVLPAFHPTVSLHAGMAVGFEALARRPPHPHLGPQWACGHTAATDRVGELDRTCIDRATDTAPCGGLTEVVCLEAIKLDNTMAQGVPGADTARLGAAIMAQRERKVTLIIAAASALLSRVP